MVPSLVSAVGLTSPVKEEEKGVEVKQSLVEALVSAEEPGRYRLRRSFSSAFAEAFGLMASLSPPTSSNASTSLGSRTLLSSYRWCPVRRATADAAAARCAPGFTPRVLAKLCCNLLPVPS